MKSISKVDNPILDLSDAMVSADIYNHTNAVMQAITEEDLAPSHKKNSNCTTINVCIDKKVHDWVLQQRSNYHLTVNDILVEAMNNQLNNNT